MIVIDEFNHVQVYLQGHNNIDVDVTGKSYYIWLWTLEYSTKIKLTSLMVQTTGRWTLKHFINLTILRWLRKILLEFGECYYESYHQQVNSLSDIMKKYSSGIDNI